MDSSKDPLTGLIMLSIIASAIWSAGAVVTGLALGSQTIIFDGLYSFVTLLLSLLSLGAARAIRRGPSERYPFGRQAFEPLANIVRAVGLGGLVLYAISTAVLDIAAGGNEVDYGWALVYAVVVAAGSGAVTLHLRRRQRSVKSGLLGAESSNWLMDTLTSVGIVIGFAVGLFLQRTGNAEAAAYTDPIIVILFSASALVIPLRMGVHAFRELVAASAPDEIVEDVRRRITDLERQYRFAESFVRVGEVAEQLDVEVYFIVGDDTPARDVKAFDEIRHALERSLDELDYDRWLTVSFTADRTFALDPPPSS